MSQISVKFDHNIKQTPIIVPLDFAGSDEDDVSGIGGNNGIKQTMIYGTRVPLIKVNDIVIAPTDVMSIELNGFSAIPRLTVTIQDSSEHIRGLQPLGLDNELRLQILPRFDNAYKKIDMTFYIENCYDDGIYFTFKCRYKIPDLYNSRIECFGNICSYDFCELIARKCSLGFATNIEKGDDKQYIYCANESYVDVMNKYIQSSGSDDIQKRSVYDWWIDFWNNVNLVDIYERYTSIDSQDDMMIYVSSNFGPDVSQVSDDENTYIKTPAIITNHPNSSDSDLYVDTYHVINRSKMVENGSDRVITTYGEDKKLSNDYFLQDGDQKRDIFTKYEYTGEYYGDYNYLLAKECRNMMIDKIESEIIEVRVNSPLISLSRGSKVNFEWYDISSKLEIEKQKLGLEDVESNIDLYQDDEKGADIQITINKQISGQYYILGSKILYDNGVWTNVLRIVRPRSNKQVIVDLHDEIQNV